MSELTNYRVSLEPPGKLRFHSAKVCGPRQACVLYHFESSKGAFKKTAH